MSITVLSDLILPEVVIRAGVSGRNLRSNTRSMTANGSVSVNIDWTKTLRQYDLGIKPMLLEAWQAIEAIHEVTEGGAYGFLMKDPKDSECTLAQGNLYPYTTELVGTPGAGYGTPTFKLAKRYTSIGGARYKDRVITRPASGSASVTRGGVPVAIGSGAGQVAVDYSSATVTFHADVSEAIATITPGASTQIDFASGAGIVAALSVGQYVYVTGVSGTAAGVLNGARHVITGKGATYLTVGTSTAGLAGTGGTAEKFPQPSEAVKCSMSFYVPVHFAEDSIDWEMLRPGEMDRRLLAGPSVTVTEVRE